MTYKLSTVNLIIVLLFLGAIVFSILNPIALSKFLFINTSASVESEIDINGQKIPTEKFYLAEVTEVISSGIPEDINDGQEFQQLRLKVLTGDKENEIIEIQNNIVTVPREVQLASTGDLIVLSYLDTNAGGQFFVSEKFRLPAVALLVIIFFFVTFIFGRTKGLFSTLGLVFSIFVIAAFILPRIIAGENPLIISLVGSIVIAVVSIYLAHGFTKRTSIALISILITITIATLMAVVAVDMAKLFGSGSEEALLLKTGRLQTISLQGLLLGGIIIGVLGVLDDVTTAQTAAVDEISKADPKLGFWELYKRGFSVGHEHIASLINTLVLAYVGAALPLLLLFNTNANVPMWVTLNNEPIVEEIVRTLVGSSALIFAVPISTVLAAYLFSHRTDVAKSTTSQPHHHHHSH